VNWNDVLDLQAPYAPAWVSSLNPSSLPLPSQKGPVSHMEKQSSPSSNPSSKTKARTEKTILGM
jgi:hypothetical protein